MIIRKSNSFIKNTKRYKKDKALKGKLKSQIRKIIENPEIGDFLTGDKKGIRKVYISPFRLLYRYDKNRDILELLDFDKRSKIYKKKRLKFKIKNDETQG